MITPDGPVLLILTTMVLMIIMSMKMTTACVTFLALLPVPVTALVIEVAAKKFSAIRQQGAGIPAPVVAL
jgi:hypothetical protein